jgi:hypothetical protein
MQNNDKRCNKFVARINPTFVAIENSCLPHSLIQSCLPSHFTPIIHKTARIKHYLSTSFWRGYGAIGSCKKRMGKWREPEMQGRKDRRGENGDEAAKME